MGDNELGSRAWQMCPDRLACTELTHRFIPNKGYEHLALIPLDEAGIYELGVGDIIGDPDATLADALVPNDDTVRVSRKALEEFIEYAESMKFSVDQEFVCFPSEQKASDEEFARLVAALKVDE